MRQFAYLLSLPLVMWGMVLSLLLVPHDLATARDARGSAKKASFSVVMKKTTFPHQINSVFVMPGELLSFKVQAKGKSTYTVQAADGELTQGAPGSWKWRAPDQSGLYRLRIARDTSQETMRLNVFVMIPASHIQQGHLNGYRIGAYPDRPLRGQPIYRQPKGFIEVTHKTKNTFLTPHFQLKQFLCKQKGDFPKYVVLREELLLKLELILETLNTNGYHCPTLNVMSGYRTPHYNRSLGNVQYSRHVWGDAADIFIDEHPRDGDMDDLNQDGVIDPQDAAVLYKLIESVEQKPAWRRLRGGLAIYRSNAFHGPFVHVDTRGQTVRWGVSPDPPEETELPQQDAAHQILLDEHS
jgi:hypothetical protein